MQVKILERQAALVIRQEPNRVGSPATDELSAFLFPWTHLALQPIWTPDENPVGFSSGPRS